MGVKGQVSLYLGMPGYRGGSYNINAILHGIHAHPTWNILFTQQNMSLLTANFNSLWAEALTLRSQGRVTHFLMLHTDIAPDGDWLGTLMAEMMRVKAQVMSAVAPIKSHKGLTSVALDTDLWQPRRLTLTEVFERPDTFTSHEPRLLVNTGLLLVDFSEPWVEQICFTINDRIIKTEKGWLAQVEPEDWNFSRQCWRLGITPWATRMVELDHWGEFRYTNRKPWGTLKTDPVEATHA